MKYSLMHPCAWLFMAICLFFSLPACATRTPTDKRPEAAVKGETKVLVAYMTWSGHLRTLAEWVADESKGELFRILTVNPYPESYTEAIMRSKEELNNNTLPELATHIPPEIMAKYNTIYIGFPIWWYDVPMPVRTFAKEYDFAGKKIIPFFSHQGTSDGGQSAKTLKAIFPKSEVVSDMLSIRGTKAKDSEAAVRAWVKKQK